MLGERGWRGQCHSLAVKARLLLRPPPAVQEPHVLQSLWDEASQSRQFGHG